ncbi:MAG: tRNA uridine-5-carboxymethylaminomethyl(34) synthesis GTPase MnmE, partial [Synechococcaceae cyanobacterium SM2_3_60]|nr:tRNA uridine-5-carboxymethylaminomethyl(34) synthesis GTPase MnmE [Synechococcaceae cyanobacterium SM2_3_60]
SATRIQANYAPDLFGLLCGSPQGNAAAQQASIEQLEIAVLEQFQQQLAPGTQAIAINQRQTVGLERAKQALALVAQAMQADLPYDFWTIDLREAIEALGELTGDSINESVLDRIFSRFCLGK